jgi:hypothetical protein
VFAKSDKFLDKGKIIKVVGDNTNNWGKIFGKIFKPIEY